MTPGAFRRLRHDDERGRLESTRRNGDAQPPAAVAGPGHRPATIRRRGRGRLGARSRL